MSNYVFTKPTSKNLGKKRTMNSYLHRVTRVGEKKFSSTPFGLWLGLRITVTWHKLIGEKHAHFIEFLHVHGAFIRKYGPEEIDHNRKLLYLLEKETINLWRIDKKKGVGYEY